MNMDRRKGTIGYAIFMIILQCVLVTWTLAADTVTSPDGRITVRCSLHMNDRPYSDEVKFYYQILYEGETVLKDSPLGITFEGSGALGSDLRQFNLRWDSHSQVYTPVYGKQKTVTDESNELTFSLQERRPPFRLVDIVFRVSNDGVAFRYRIPRQDVLEIFRITAEHSRFCFEGDVVLYALPLESFQTHYEANAVRSRLSELAAETLIACPLLIDTGGGPWMAISEADLTDYAGMYLRRVENFPLALESALSPRFENPSFCVEGEAPFSSPWRVILMGDAPGDLIESHFIMNLNDRCAIEDVSWIRPGKCAWPWWSGRWVEGVEFEGGMNTETMLHYLDFAAESGLEYLLIDAGWYGIHNRRDEDITTTIPEIDMPRILAEAEERGVGILLWLFWECVDDQMDKAFPLYDKWGVKGVKIDYMNRDDQEMVRFYHRAVQKAAAHRLLVDFHGAYKPTGIRRTWPNLITREGVLGLEWSKWTDRCNPEHELILPFTRMLAGPMDFTPGCFRTRDRSEFQHGVQPPVVQGTRCHQLAMYVVYESPLQMCVDYPAAYRNQPGFAFLKAVPTTWDSTIVVEGVVGEYIVMARKNGESWYVGAMTNWTPRNLEIPLDFLGTGAYRAEIYSDGQDRRARTTDVNVYDSVVTASESLLALLASGGGYVARITPAE